MLRVYEEEHGCGKSRIPPGEQCDHERVEQHRYGPVERDVDEVMGAQVHAEERDIRHVREPRQRVPVGGVKRTECPADTLEAQATPHHEVVFDVSGVVEIDVAVVPGLRIDQEQRDAEQQHGLPVGKPPALSRRWCGMCDHCARLPVCVRRRICSRSIPFCHWHRKPSR